MGPNSFLPAVVTAIERRIGAGNSRNSGDRSTMRAIRSLWWLCHVPFDIGEEEGDGAGGEIGHGRLHTCCWPQFLPIVAWPTVSLRRRGHQLIIVP